MLISQSAVRSFAITASDSTDISCGAVYVGGTGTIIVKHHATDTAVTYTALPVGTILPIRITNGRIMAASSASNLVGMEW